MKDVTRLPLGAPEHVAVRNPELARMVELARRQPTPRVSVDAESIHAAWKARRAQRRRWLGMAAAAALVGLVAASAHRGLRHEEAEPLGTESRRVAVSEPRSVDATHQARDAGADGASVEVASRDAARGVEALADGVRLEPHSADAAHTVLGPWSVEVAAGVYEVAAPIEAVSSLHVRVGGRTLVVEPGGMVRIEAGDRPEAELLSGDAAWIERDGRRISLPAALADGAASRRADAAALARKAERLMAAGDRKGAISAYRTLVRKYPRSSSARAGLLDLARLLKATGDSDGARCAYTQYLERWPNNHLRPEIEHQLAGLGSGPKCRDL